MLMKLMNLRSFLLTAFISFVYRFASFAAASKDSEVKTKILKAVVYNLPAPCKSLHNTGSFNALSSKSYACLFEDGSFDVKRSAKILTLLMQRGNEKLVGEIAKIWVSKRQWGPFNQFEIAKELSAILAVKTSARTGDKKDEDSVKIVEIDLKTIYATFKLLLNSGNGLIVADPIYYGLVSKIFKLANKFETDNKERGVTASLVLKYFYAMDSEDKKTKDNYKLMTKAYLVASSLNGLAKKGKINAEAWEVYGPVICSNLNTICGTAFVMAEREAKSRKKDSESESDSSDSDSSNSESSSDSGEEPVVEDGKDKPVVKPMKFIQLPSKFTSTYKSSPSNDDKARTTTELGTKEWFMIGGGSTLFLALVAFSVYWFMFKEQKKMVDIDSDEL